MSRQSNGLVLLAAGSTLLALGLRRAARSRRRLAFAGQSVVVTGGSRGLGLVLARQLARQGARLALLARDPVVLEQAEQELLERDAEVMVLACDVGEREQVERSLARVVRRYGRIDVLINNAGIIQVGPMEHMTLDDYQEAMAVHFWGPLYASQAAVVYMRQQGGGRIVNITSIGGEVAVPHLLPYTASKFAFVGLSDGMRAELAKDNILVTTVIPGLMRTGSHVNAWFKGQHELEYAWFSISSSSPLTSISAEKAARQILEACQDGRTQLVITPQARLLVILNVLFPGSLAALSKLANRLLPGPEPRFGDVAKTGWESQSRWSPSALTHRGDQKVIENNELIPRITPQ